MIKVRQFIRFENATEDDLEEIEVKWQEVSYLYGDKFIKFFGTPERLQELIRYADKKALKPILK